MNPVDSGPDAAHTGTTRRRRIGAKLALALAAVMLALVVAELGLRLAGRADIVCFTPSADFGFLMTPNQEVYTYGFPTRINSLGLRGPELQNPKPADVRRIVFIGDSITYGGGRIAEDALFCRIVEQRLNRQGKRVEVVNLSAPGWSPQNWMNYIDQHSLHEADIVVLVLPQCDLARPYATMQLAGHQSRGSMLRLGNIAQKAWAIASHVSRTNRGEYSASEQVSVVEHNVDAVERLREKVAARPFLTVLVPSEGSGEHWSAFEPVLGDVLDLREVLVDQELFDDGVHLNAAGHRLVGQRAAEALAGYLD